VDPAPGAPPAVPAPAPKSVTAGPPASRSARPRADAEVGGSSRVEAYTPAPPQVPAPETPPAKSIPRVVLLFDKKQQDTANALKKEITDLLGDAVTVEPLTFTKATAGAVDPKTLVFARMLTGNPIVDKIAAKYGAAKKYGKILNKQFPQADVVVVIGTKEHVR
jgi:hypothetical protein